MPKVNNSRRNGDERSRPQQTIDALVNEIIRKTRETKFSRHCLMRRVMLSESTLWAGEAGVLHCVFTATSLRDTPLPV